MSSMIITSLMAMCSEDAEHVADIQRIPGLQSKSGISLLTRRTVYETSMALVTFSFGAVFGMVMVRMPSSTLAEIWSFTTSSGST